MEYMICLECGIIGCGCYQVKGSIKSIPRDHDKELKIWLRDLSDETK